MIILFKLDYFTNQKNNFSGQVEVDYNVNTNNCDRIVYSDFNFTKDVSFEDELELQQAINNEVQKICLLD